MRMDMYDKIERGDEPYSIRDASVGTCRRVDMLQEGSLSHEQQWVPALPLVGIVREPRTRYEAKQAPYRAQEAQQREALLPCGPFQAPWQQHQQQLLKQKQQLELQASVNFYCPSAATDLARCGMTPRLDGRLKRSPVEVPPALLPTQSQSS